jgi:tetratricopeptide (TPR) repeat protein
VKLDRTSRNYLSKLTPETSRELEQFVLLLSFLREATGNLRSDLAKQFLDGGAYFPAAAALYIHYLDSGKDLNAYLKRLDDVGKRFPSDAGIQLSVATAVGYKATGTLRRDMIKRLQSLVKENPNDPTSITSLAELLNEDYQHFEAMTLCEEAIKRWPNLYRVWWTTSYVINHYAGYLRGMKSWSEVSSKGKRLWHPLRDLAYQAVNRAIELHPYVPQLWVQKMYAISEYSQEMMNCFYKAIEYGPHYDRAYIAALIFTMPQWGGSAEAQQEVYDIALKNNPYAPWLEKIKRELMRPPPERH